MRLTRLQLFGQLSQAEPNIFLRRDSRWLRHAAKQQQERNQKYDIVCHCDGIAYRCLVLRWRLWQAANCRKKLIRNLNLLRSFLQFQRFIDDITACMEFVYCSSSITRRSVIVFESENQSDPKKLLCCLVLSKSICLPCDVGGGSCHQTLSPEA